jgi:glycosyltransferase involved in cell wall biosynthesis
MLLSEDTSPAARVAAMPDSITATLLITTYNRASLLRDTLMSVARLRTPIGVVWDVVVVDNNSKDNTREVVEEASRSFPVPLTYVFESRQGKSIALNTALATISSSIIVFSDDDVRVPEDWLENAVRPLVEHPEIGYVGGPVRPLWSGEPPGWVRNSGRAHGVIAVLDYGAKPFVFEERRLIPLGVNMAVRRSVIEQVGGFHPALGRRGGSLLGQEQAEFFLRCRRGGARGLYVPEMTLEHLVAPDRLSLKYFVRWWFWKGVSHARWYRMHKETELGVDLTSVRTLLRIPLFIYSTALSNAAAAVRAGVTGRMSDLLFHGFMLAYSVGYAVESWFGPSPAPVDSPRLSTENNR